MGAVNKKVAIVQSNYIPWKGYFDLINLVDEFVLYDDVQYTRRDWRNRNLIKTPGGLAWLTIPVEAKGHYHEAIRHVRIADPAWGRRHWATLEHTYGRAAHFDDYRRPFEPLYLATREPSLSLTNRAFIETICGLLGIATRISWSWEHPRAEGRTDRLIAICKSLQARVYVSGPAARAYLDEASFHAEGIEVQWMDYSGYPDYRQLHGPFEHGVTILDLLFNEGPAASRYLKTFAGAGRE
jgi:hypothetical protein